MLFWLYGFIARVALGEQLTPADRDDYRLWSAVFFLVPVGVAAIWLGNNFLDHASNLVGWLFVIVGTLIFYIIWAIWARFVPAAVSFIFGAVIWIAGLWMAWHGRLWF
jgi:uncharacterized membrane protein YobD (UPF0266 family)